MICASLFTMLVAASDPNLTLVAPVKETPAIVTVARRTASRCSDSDL